MPVVQAKAQLSTKTLLKVVNQMSLPEMEQFAAQFLDLRARRKAPSLSQTETDLLTKINQGLSPEMQARLERLVKKRRAEILASEELDELLDLTEQLEHAEATRVQALAQLATLRGVPLATLMQDLGIFAPEYA